MTQDDFVITTAREKGCASAHRAHLYGLAEVEPGPPLTNGQRIESDIWDMVAVAALLVSTGVIRLRFDAGLMLERFDKLTRDLRHGVERGTVHGPCSLLLADPARRATAYEVAHGLAAYMRAGAPGPAIEGVAAEQPPPPAPDEAMRDPAASRWFLSALEGAMQRDPVDAANDAEALARILDQHAKRVLEAARAGLALRPAS